jgi:hypothetical protein
MRPSSFAKEAVCLAAIPAAIMAAGGMDGCVRWQDNQAHIEVHPNTSDCIRPILESLVRKACPSAQRTLGLGPGNPLQNSPRAHQTRFESPAIPLQLLECVLVGPFRRFVNFRGESSLDDSNPIGSCASWTPGTMPLNVGIWGCLGGVCGECLRAGRLRCLSLHLHDILAAVSIDLHWLSPPAASSSESLAAKSARRPMSSIRWSNVP